MTFGEVEREFAWAAGVANSDVVFGGVENRAANFISLFIHFESGEECLLGVVESGVDGEFDVIVEFISGDVGKVLTEKGIGLNNLGHDGRGFFRGTIWRDGIRFNSHVEKSVAGDVVDED